MCTPKLTTANTETVDFAAHGSPWIAASKCHAIRDHGDFDRCLKCPRVAFRLATVTAAYKETPLLMGLSGTG
jgi:hypothetical protein